MDKNLVQRSIAGLVFLAVMVSGICYNYLSAISLFLLIALLGSVELVNLFAIKKSLGNGRFLLVAFQTILVVFAWLIFGGYFPTAHAVHVVAGLLIAGTAALFMLKNDIETRLALVFAFIAS
ncbi:MAG TPA: hypothetical protein VD905_11980, partial [Flavobacteriales bacterium]|nr:hypothetical protein [Flavobacteriales bacterium]